MYGTAGNKKQQKRVEPCIDQWPSLDFECNGSYRSEKLNLVYAFPCSVRMPSLHSVCITAFLDTTESLPANS